MSKPIITLEVHSREQLRALLDAIGQYVSNQGEYVGDYPDDVSEEDREKLAVAESYMEQLDGVYVALADTCEKT